MEDNSLSIIRSSIAADKISSLSKALIVIFRSVFLSAFAIEPPIKPSPIIDMFLI
jgi:hypothetical protein